MSRFLSLLCLALLLALSGLACHHGDDDGNGVSVPPAMPSTIQCRWWDGGHDRIVIDTPVSDADRIRFKLCLRGEYPKDKERRLACYYDCPYWKDGLGLGGGKP